MFWNTSIKVKKSQSYKALLRLNDQNEEKHNDKARMNQTLNDLIAE